MPKTTCSVVDCDRTAKSRGWCHAHYMFWYEGRGEPSGPIRKWGRSRVEKCSVEGCELPFESSGYCAPHRKRVDAYGSPGAAAIKPRTVGDDASYGTVHDRMMRNSGSASNYSCARCAARAKDWAYDHEDPNERVDPNGLAYSLSPGHYRPLCRSCHRNFDHSRRNGTRFDFAN